MDFFKPPAAAAPDAIESGLRIANPAFESCDPLTFRNPTRFSLAAPAWRDTLFVPHILPSFLETLDHARNGKTREIIALEAALIAATPAPISVALITQGLRLVGTTGDPRGDRVLPKLHAAIRDERMRGHFTILFAARCAVFSLPDRTALEAYVFQELLAGSPSTPAHTALDFAATCLESIDLTGFRLRAA